MSEDFFPDGLRIDPIDSKLLRLVWLKDAGHSLSVVLRKSQLPPVAAMLHSQIEAGSTVPVNIGSLRPGLEIDVTTFQFGFAPDHLLLTAIAELPERTVTIPLRLSESEVETCMSEMSRWLTGRRR